MAIVKEVTFGTMPSVTFAPIRLTGSDLNLKFDSLTSAEISDDRQVRSFRHGMMSTEGSIDIEIAVGDNLALWEGALAGAWTGSTGAWVLKAGTALNTYCVQRKFADGPQYDMMMGTAFNGVSISITPDKMATAKFSLIGRAAAVMQGTAYAVATTAVSTTQPLDAFTGSVTEGVTPVAVVTSCEIKLENGRKAEGVIGSRYTPAIFEGTCNVTGTATVLFESATLYNKFVNETESALSITLTDGDSGEMTFVLPKIKYGTGNFQIPKEGPITLQMEFQALYDSVSGTAFYINSNHA
jgi:hypothetical protein